ncbi:MULTISPECIES: DUF1707 SHOCT-like domain-containing protein [Corynebacterium]|uniref:Membrane protein n=3 Tax=Corynebacterium flavescens TaxID=28028 RepID=A0AB73B9K0_CORFL|nr:membrane protein [Corynebacterium flavescens]
MSVNSMNDDSENIRVGDSERSRALDELSTHFANGLIDINEFEERTGKAAIAKTRGDIRKLFLDLPRLDGTDPVAGEPHPNAPAPIRAETRAQEELDEVLTRGKKVQRFDGLIFAVAMILFFLGLFVFDWDYFWIVFPLAGVAAWGVRSVANFSDEDEEIFDELNESEEKERAERLRRAAERRRELGK